MKKVFIILFLFSITFLKTSAHPLDISSTSWYFKDNQLRVTTFFHTYEIEYLLNLNKIYFKSTNEYFNNKSIIKDYVEKNIKLESDWLICKLENFDLVEKQEYEILTYWLETNYLFICDKKINKWNLNITFFSNFPLQTNQLFLYDINSNYESKSFLNNILTNDFNKIYFDLNDKLDLCKTDNDGDWLSDELEKVYKTNWLKIDTDWDFYTDYEEINSSFSPLDKNLWPWQIPREEIPIDILENIKKSIISKDDCEKFLQTNSDIKKSNWLLNDWFWNEYFAKTLKNISDYLYNKNQSTIFYILFIVFILWFIHAAWPWHSKSLLVSYIVDKNKTLFDWLVFIFIFTVTHLIDIILIFLVTKIILWVYDISNYILVIQKISLIILLLFSLYLIIRSIKNYWKNQQKCYKNDKNSSIFLWFVSWLAPCTFWWSIFLLLFSIWNFYLIIPMLIALWLWIFTFLLLLLFIVYFLRVKFFEKINVFSKLSSLLSSIILFTSAIVLSINLF